jgi:DNA-directed RNA polymerase specialized sigma24 family protein
VRSADSREVAFAEDDPGRRMDSLALRGRSTMGSCTAEEAVAQGFRERKGRTDSPAAGADVHPAFLDWTRVWSGCERRLRSWRVPPRWSVREWLEEMQAEGVAAALMAARDYQSERNVPLGAYVRMRVMGQVLTRYRKEWAYALHQAPVGTYDGLEQESRSERGALSWDEVAWAIGRLRDVDRQLIERLFWRGDSEAEVARALGLSQQAVNKRKHCIFNDLRHYLRAHREK